jgi:hypothetical protein
MPSSAYYRLKALETFQAANLEPDLRKADKMRARGARFSELAELVDSRGYRPRSHETKRGTRANVSRVPSRRPNPAASRSLDPTPRVKPNVIEEADGD